MRTMKTVPLSEAKDKLSALVEEADSTHEIVQITRHGRPSAVLMSADDLESMQETLFWLQQPAIREDLAEGEHEHQAGETLSGKDLRARYGLPPSERCAGRTPMASRSHRSLSARSRPAPTSGGDCDRRVRHRSASPKPHTDDQAACGRP